MTENIETLVTETETETTITACPVDHLSSTCAILKDLLVKNNGVVSSRALRKHLMDVLKIDDDTSRALITRLYTEVNPCGEDILSKGRSFYTKEKYASADASVQAQADIAANKEATAPEPPLAVVESVKTDYVANKQEEARLNTYVIEALKQIYSTEFVDDSTPYVFDVHNDRPGSVYENVDIVGVHFRNEGVAEIFAIETKLEFTAKAIQQALNYTRFANRVWLAVPVTTHEGAEELRAIDESLFEYAVEKGIGILACRKAKGRSYEVRAVHYPKRQVVDPVDRVVFVERYRSNFEAAGLIERKQQRKASVF